MTTYSTKDLHEAAAIQAYSGFEPIDLEDNNGVIWFVFEGDEEPEEIAHYHWRGQLQVSSSKYSNALNSLKKRLFASKNRRTDEDHKYSN